MENFDSETINYRQLVKERRGGRVIGKTKTIIFGKVDDVDIGMVHIEKYNLALRHDISQLISKSLCFSKFKKIFDNHIDMYQCYNNLIGINSVLTNKQTKKKEPQNTMHS